MNSLLLLRFMVLILLCIFLTDIASAADASTANKLLKAAASHNPAEVKRLLDGGADPNAAAKSNNETPVFRSVMALDYDATALLLDRGARIDHKDISDMSVLTAACGRLDFRTGTAAPAAGSTATAPPGLQAMRIVRMLVERGASVTITPPPAGKQEETSSGPLHNAASNPHATVELFQFLLSKGADINQPMRSTEKSLDGVTPLMSATIFNSKEVVLFLIDQGANVHARSATGDNAIRWAFLRDSMKYEGLQELFFARGAILTAADKKAVLQPMFSGFHKELKQRLVEVHGMLSAAVIKEPALEKAPLHELLTKAGVSDGSSIFSVFSAQCRLGSCDVILRHQFAYSDHCSPVGELMACAGRITGPPGKTVITMSELTGLAH